MLLCLSDPLPAVHQHRGALWGPERGHPGSPRLRSTEASVSQAAHNTTLLPLQLATLPPRSPRTACLSARQGPTRLRSGWGGGAVPILAPDQTPLILSLSPPYSFFSLGCCSPSRGPGPLGERVWCSTVNICVQHMCEMDQELYTFFPPLA